MLENEKLSTWMKIFAFNFFKGYRERVDEYYHKEAEQYPEYFHFIQKCHLYAIHLEQGTKIIISKLPPGSSEDKITSVFPTDDIHSQIDGLRGKPDYILEKILLDLCKLSKGEMLKYNDLHDFGSDVILGFKDYNAHLLPSIGHKAGVKEADGWKLSFLFSEAVKEVIKPSATYSKFDVESLFHKVDTESFRYELEESVKAYNSELYLAAGATSGIALENLLKTLVVRHFGIKGIPKQTYIKDLLKVLKDRNIIDERMSHRVKSVAILRNSSAHSNTGKVVKEDVDQAFFIIRELVNLLP